MANTWFLYDNDARTVISRQFNVAQDKPLVLTAGDLVDPVQIYIAVGRCFGCDKDLVWEPLTLCGSPVELSPENTMLAISTPGIYNLGDPTVDPFLLGPNTNVIAQVVSEVPAELSGGCGEKGPVTIDSSCDSPVFVQMCDTTVGSQVEISDVTLGHVLDADCVATGVVVLSKLVDEDTGLETQRRVAYMYDGSVVDPFVGSFGLPCPVTCPIPAFMGVITDLSLLN